MAPEPSETATGEPPDGEESRAELTYRWTIRALYLTLLAANLYIVWDAYADTAEMLVFRAKVRARVGPLLERLRNCEGCARRKEFIERQLNKVTYQATQIVEEAKPGEAET